MKEMSMFVVWLKKTAYLEKFYLYPFPFPSHLGLAIIELDLLHSGDELE